MTQQSFLGEAPLQKPALIVMLTKDDFAVMNAAEIFGQCKDTRATCWGFKEHPLPLRAKNNSIGTTIRK